MLSAFRPATLWRTSRRLHQRGWRRSARAVKLLNFMLYKCLLPAEAEVGENLRLEHYAIGVVMHPNVVIGSNVCIFHQVTLAATTWRGSEYKIVIEDDVMIGTGAVILGRGDQTLRIGKGAKVGAGAVVTGDVAAGDTVVGVPARSITIKR